MQVLVQLLLHVFDGVVAVDEVLVGAMLLASVQDDWVVLRLLHQVAPELVH